jgi:hypothetical protein
MARVVRLDSKADDGLRSWYESTFSDELSEVTKSFARASEIRESGASFSSGLSDDADGSATAAAGVADGKEGSDFESSSVVSAKKLEFALLQASAQAEAQLAEKDLLATRLVCLEELDELRLRLALLESQLELQASEEAERVAAQGTRWDQDEDNPQCRRCGAQFGLLRRKHHCRKCGRVFCGDCAPKNHVAPLPLQGFHEPVRHCLGCLPPRGASSAASSGASSPNPSQRPFSSAIEAVRRTESACLKQPTAGNLVAAMQAYVRAVERIAKADAIEDGELKRRAQRTLMRSMHVFLQLPQVQPAVKDAAQQQGAERRAEALHDLLRPGLDDDAKLVLARNIL